MTTQEAASTMKIRNFRIGIGTLDVNRCEDMIQLDEWLEEVFLDVEYLNNIIRSGKEEDNIIQAMKLQKILAQQIKNRQKYLHELYQPIIDYFKLKYSQEYYEQKNLQI